MPKPISGIFVDDSNLFYAQKTAGWKVDLAKLKLLLQKEVRVSFIRYYLAVPEKWDLSYRGTQTYLKHLKNQHVEVRAKPVKYIKAGSKVIKKGDVDLEIALDVVRLLPNLDLVLVISGDSDYVELRNYVTENGKKIVFMGFKHNMAWELKQGKYLLFEKIKLFIERGGKKTPGLTPGRILLPPLNKK